VNAAVAPHLALILFLPWYAVLCWVFWRMRARDASAGRKLVVGGFIALSLITAGIAGDWAYGHADTSVGAIWKQLFASSVGYAAFLSVLLVGGVALRSSTRSGGTSP
jgi:hypothetical protein